MTTTTVRDQPDRSRYEILVDDQVAGLAAYRLDGTTISFTHTETDEEFAGQGLGKQLVVGALDDARERGLAVLPHCPFVRSYIAKHEEYLDLVPTDQRARFDLG